MSKKPETMRVIVPLTNRKRNGRPKILPPENAGMADQEAPGQDPHILRALGRAWAWRRMLESGKAATINDIAAAENVTNRFVSRTMRLAYLAPKVLERLVVKGNLLRLPLTKLIKASYLPWMEQVAHVPAAVLPAMAARSFKNSFRFESPHASLAEPPCSLIGLTFINV